MVLLLCPMQAQDLRAKSKGAGKHRNQSMPGSQATENQLIDLIAAMFTPHAPLAEVFAIIRQQVVAILAQARAGPANYFVPVGPTQFLDAKPDRASLSELRKGHLFHRTSTQSAGQASVLHHPSSTHVDAVMRITPTRRHHVRPKGRLQLRIERFIARQSAAMAALPSKAMRLPMYAIDLHPFTGRRLPEHHIRCVEINRLHDGFDGRYFGLAGPQPNRKPNQLLTI